MGNMMQMMHVANCCPGYSATISNIESNMGLENSKSCSNCNHWKDKRCNINLFDSVLISLDQT